MDFIFDHQVLVGSVLGLIVIALFWKAILWLFGVITQSARPSTRNEGT